RMKQHVENSIGVITAVNPYIGYEAASRIAKEALRTGKSVRELCLEYDLLNEKQLHDILDPYAMTSPSIAGK
ncbi:aspartate ammonia-lyase, partial [Klebsiella pneumoniae subsp. pneumoniae]